MHEKISFKSIPNEEKPREKLIKYGSSNLSNEDLLSIILKTGTKKYSVKEVSLLLLSKLKSIEELKKLSLKELESIPGIGKIKAIELQAAIELGKRVNNQKINTSKSFTDPKIIAKYFYNILKDKTQEEFYVVYLDNKKKYLKEKLLFIGTINKSIIHPREIFKEAYLLSASYIICIHNHPSGDIIPSKDDVLTTRLIKEIGIIHQIPLVDHIIIGKGKYYSFYENNNL